MAPDSAATTAAPDTPPAGTAAPHPEEMRASIDLRIGKAISFNATARATPAGLIAAAVLVAAVLLPVAMIVRRPRSGARMD